MPVLDVGADHAAHCVLPRDLGDKLLLLALLRRLGGFNHILDDILGHLVVRIFLLAHSLLLAQSLFVAHVLQTAPPRIDVIACVVPVVLRLRLRLRLCVLCDLRLCVLCDLRLCVLCALRLCALRLSRSCVSLHD